MLHTLFPNDEFYGQPHSMIVDLQIMDKQSIPELGGFGWVRSLVE